MCVRVVVGMLVRFGVMVRDLATVNSSVDETKVWREIADVG
jgi:hypothetical protein